MDYATLKSTIESRTLKSVNKFSSTQVNIGGSLKDDIKKYAESIPKEDLHDDGIETTPHVTLRYGLHTQDPKDVAEHLKDEPPVHIKLGEISSFPASDTGAPYDVLKMNVESPDLHRLNKKLGDNLPNTNTHDEFRPHATIAYVKPGEGKKYHGTHVLNGREAIIKQVTFSNKGGISTDIPLGSATKSFDENEARDDHGRWTSGGSTGEGVAQFS